MIKYILLFIVSIVTFEANSNPHEYELTEDDLGIAMEFVAGLPENIEQIFRNPLTNTNYVAAGQVGEDLMVTRSLHLELLNTEEAKEYMQDHGNEFLEGIGKLTFLNVLSLEKFDFRAIPSPIANLVNLMGLNLSNNKLSQVPSDLFRLPYLEGINFAHNKIRRLPTSIMSLVSRRNFVMGLEYNPVETSDHQGLLGSDAINRLFGNRIRVDALVEFPAVVETPAPMVDENDENMGPNQFKRRRR